MRKAKGDLETFTFGFAKTRDESDAEHPIKPFPDYPYLRWLAWVWNHFKYISVAKSRQMVVTWFFVIACTHEAAYNQARRTYFQTINYDKADKLIDRAEVVIKHLPRGLRPKYERRYCRLRFPDMDSIIEGVSQEPDALRSETASTIFSDEQSIQPFAEEAYAAAGPTIANGGRYVSVGTPKGQNFFWRIYADRLESTGHDGTPEPD